MALAGRNPCAGLNDPKLKRPRLLLAVALFCGILAATVGKGTPPAWGVTDGETVTRQVDLDPLRRFLPRSDIFMQVPGGVSAVSSERTAGESIEAQKHASHGGLVVGYCLRASCSRVTHLAILQVCNNRIGGLDDSNRLILGVIKLPFGEVRGHLMSLQGRNYAENFALNGPYKQDLAKGTVSDSTAVHRVWAEGMGPVAPIEYQGLSVNPEQSHETIALQMSLVRYPRTGLRLPLLEVRHFCERPMS